MLRSDLCDYSNAYIVAKWTITVDGNYDNKKRDKKLPFKKDAHLDHAYQKSVTNL